VVVGVDQGDVEFDVLTKLQRAAGQGQLAQAMASYIECLAEKKDQIDRRLGHWRRRLADSFMPLEHRRTAEQLGELLMGWGAFLLFAFRAGAIDRETRMELWREGQDTLGELGRAQAGRLVDQNPTTLFLRLIRSALDGGRAHVLGKDGRTPRCPGAWGWTQAHGGSWSCMGSPIGYAHKDDLYLLPGPAYSMAVAEASKQNGSLAVNEQTLWKRLHEAGLLRSTEERRRRHTVRKTLGGSRRPVLHVAAGSVLGSAARAVGQSTDG